MSLPADSREPVHPTRKPTGPESNHAALLQARGLSFARNDEPIFGPLDFEVAPGEALLVHGGNGSGKTTLLRVLAGLLEPGSGEIRIAGARETREAVARNTALLGHLLGHKGELSTSENLRFAVGLYGQREGSRIDAVLEQVGLGGYEDTPARLLSAGQRKRLALARLSLLPARLWLMDEPYANLDLPGIDLVNRLIEQHLARDGAALITSHGAYATGAVRTRTLELDASRGVPGNG
ncbi:MAG: heme ABC exporter ATP-binding protein CcmA [Chiayiivirga sp.]|jgi:heme exporter protein A|uniref:heme ABC exporter ATP-binding protein CcmA n=1 Tax=Chiayiivirga sp. TaxID=2041042 RepID=UPI0025C4E0C1|nr:heme ABC exporter ATP-binding protein CcmA [Chiayiivirga sp.]MCI1709623.1 heme ABC exporter ATP-binding protein CcmA [Chiayiivirga sp.]MCI1730091.1 heme ABC exporter ATP-binding protein CcmA [Chiayiivirga sp.]